MQPWRSKNEFEIDEEETVESTAGLGGHFYPVTRAAQERWYAVDVIAEDDPAILLWRETLREFSQLLRDTGAFQDVREWHLRVEPPERAGADTVAALESPEGARVSPRFVTGTGTRRLLLFATHGASTHWLDGAYKQVLEAWLSTSTVALLHLLPRHQWKQTVLGAPQGLCHAQRPGLASSLLDADPFWWMSINKAEAPFVPVIGLNSHDVMQFAHMQMARGRSAPVVFLDTSRAALEPEFKHPVAAPLVDFAATSDVESIIAALKSDSPEAFRLAVYLCPSEFTLPVARVVQEVKFGREAPQSLLAEFCLADW